MHQTTQSRISVVSDHCYSSAQSATSATGELDETSLDVDHSYATAEAECSSCATRTQQLKCALTDLAELNIRHSTLLARRNCDTVLACHSFIGSDKDVQEAKLSLG